MIDKVTANARKPKEDTYGYKMLDRMNERHKELHSWALEHITLDKVESILDIGFGGGKNIYNLRKMCPESKVCGIDYSSASLKKCTELNKKDVESGMVSLVQGSAENLPYEDCTFDLCTAFETVYYWPHIEKCFENVFNKLKNGGIFLICNEDSSVEGNESIAKDLDMNFYSGEELLLLLDKAGFKESNAFTNVNGKWVCAIGRKY